MKALDDGEHEAIRVGSHSIFITNHDGEPEITVRDHLEMHIEGEHKQAVDVVYTSGEFGASFERVNEREFWERYHE